MPDIVEGLQINAIFLPRFLHGFTWNAIYVKIVLCHFYSDQIMKKACVVLKLHTS